MNDPYFQRLFAHRIGGPNYGKGREIYKFEKIKRAKRRALAEHPERQLLDFGIGDNDERAAETVRRALAVEVEKPENRGYADNGIAEFKQAVARFMARQFEVPLDPATEMGPLTSRLHQERVISYVEVAKQQGAEVLAGGKTPDAPELSAGCFVEPTVVRAQPQDRVAQEEVFGPFCSVHTFKDEAEALALANGVRYGLGSGLWTRDIQRAHRVAKGLKAGMVWINCYNAFDASAPFGGFKMSGIGRELGEYALTSYTEVKTVVTALGR